MLEFDSNLEQLATIKVIGVGGGIEQEKQNRELQKELLQKQAKVSNIEKDLAQEKQLFFNLAKDTEKYRMYLGKVKVKGTGLQVTLEDGSDMDSEANVNNYLVHQPSEFMKLAMIAFLADKTKRPIMAEIACRLASDPIFTSDNPLV